MISKTTDLIPNKLKSSRNFYPLTHSQIHHFETPKFEEAADDKYNVAIIGFFDTDCIENIVGKGEIALFEQFHLFPQCFPYTFIFNVLK